MLIKLYRRHNSEIEFPHCSLLIWWDIIIESELDYTSRFETPNLCERPLLNCRNIMNIWKNISIFLMEQFRINNQQISHWNNESDFERRWRQRLAVIHVIHSPRSWMIHSSDWMTWNLIFSSWYDFHQN